MLSRIFCRSALGLGLGLGLFALGPGPRIRLGPAHPRLPSRRGLALGLGLGLLVRFWRLGVPRALQRRARPCPCPCPCPCPRPCRPWPRVRRALRRRLRLRHQLRPGWPLLPSSAAPCGVGEQLCPYAFDQCLGLGLGNAQAASRFRSSGRRARDSPARGGRRGRRCGRSARRCPHASPLLLPVRLERRRGRLQFALFLFQRSVQFGDARDVRRARSTAPDEKPIIPAMRAARAPSAIGSSR